MHKCIRKSFNYTFTMHICIDIKKTPLERQKNFLVVFDGLFHNK